MARKILIVYFSYTVLIFLTYTYVIKTNYYDALLKAIISGVIFTALYALIAMRAEKRREDERNKTLKK